MLHPVQRTCRDPHSSQRSADAQFAQMDTQASVEYVFEPISDFVSHVCGDWVHRSGIYSDKTALVFDSYPCKAPNFNQTKLCIGFTKDRLDVQACAENLLEISTSPTRMKRPSLAACSCSPSPIPAQPSHSPHAA